MMYSKILQKDKDDLTRLYKSMTPQERLVVFANHSEALVKISRAGANFRKKNPAAKRRSSLKS